MRPSHQNSKTENKASPNGVRRSARARQQRLNDSQNLPVATILERRTRAACGDLWCLSPGAKLCTFFHRRTAYKYGPPVCRIGEVLFFTGGSPCCLLLCLAVK